MSGEKLLECSGWNIRAAVRPPAWRWLDLWEAGTSSMFRLEHCDECSNRNISPKCSSRNIVLNVPVGTLGAVVGTDRQLPNMICLPLSWAEGLPHVLISWFFV